MPETIVSPHNPRFKKALKLHSARGRKQQCRIIIFGLREIERAVAAGIELDEVFFSESMFESTEIAASHQIVIGDDLMARLEYGDRRQGIVATAQRPSTELANIPDCGTSRLLLVLESIEKPGNLGAILRSLDAVGADGLLIADPRCDTFHPNAIRSSTGVVFSMPIGCGSTVEIQTWLQEQKIRVLTAFPEDAQNFHDVDLQGDIAIVLGNEAIGLSESWRSATYQAVKLPMRGQADSLNVSVTASVMLFEALRQRR